MYSGVDKVARGSCVRAERSFNITDARTNVGFQDSEQFKLLGNHLKKFLFVADTK